MKKIALIIALLTFGISFAQTFSIKNGTPYRVDDGSQFNYYIGNNESGVYLARTTTKGKGITKVIQKLDSKTLAEVYSSGFVLDKYEEITNQVLLENKIIVFTSVYNKEEQTKYCILREFDNNTGKMIGDKKVVGSLPSDPMGVNGRNFYVIFSPNRSKLLIISEFKWPKKASEVKAEIYETASYKKLATKNIIGDYANSTISSFDYRIDNTGNLYYLFYYMMDFEEEIGGWAFASEKLTDTKTSITPLPFAKLEIQNGTFEFVNNDLMFCGVYKDIVKKKEKKEGKVADVGVYSFFFDGASGEIKRKGFDYFKPEIKEKLTYKDGLIEESPAKKFYSLENIITFNNNAYLIESHSYAISSNNGYTSYERELIVSKFNTEGKLEWMRIIPKFTANNLTNFNFLVKNNKVYLFYAEHPKNLEKYTVDNYDARKYNDIKNYNGSVLVCTTFDENGILSRKEVFKNEGWCYDPISTNILLDKDNGLLLRMINRGEERYDKITIQ
jgi:hypothetical protein